MNLDSKVDTSIFYSEIATNLEDANCMTRSKYLLCMIFFGGCFFSASDLSAQTSNSEIKSKSFYYLPEVQLIASQLDGDNAAGYNKFGYLGQINFGWKQSDKQAFEFAIGFAERGSRRGYNPDIPNLNPFHIRYRSLETALNYQFPLNAIKESWDIPLDLHAGLRFGRILQIEDTEQYALYLEQVYRKMTVSLEFGARYPLNENWVLSARANYSAISMLNEGASNNPLYPTGVYNNAIGFGLIYQMND